jgi:transposase-like protein
MNAKKWATTPAASATPWDHCEKSELSATEKLVMESQRSAYRFRHENFALDIDFFNSFKRDSCPYCKSTAIKKSGLEQTGMQRYRCHGCKRAFTPVTGTIFEARKLPISAWVDFLIQAFSFESIAVMTREDRRSGTTVPYWLGKTFAVLDGIQDGIVLADNVQIDETYYPVPIVETVSIDGKRLRGLSRNKICIGIGCDRNGHSYFTNEGLGKTSSTRTMAAFKGHIKPGSHLVHDMEKSHRRLVRKLNLTEEAYNSKKLVGLSDKDNPLADVNRLCYLMKRFLNNHSGFDRDDLDGWLNLFSVAMNPPSDKIEKSAFVLNRAMGNSKTLRFREFYNVKCS